MYHKRQNLDGAAISDGMCVQVKNTLEQIQRLRSAKISAGLQLLVGPITVKLNNLSAMEVNTIRPFFQGSLDRFDGIFKVRVAACLPAVSLLCAH